jgi:AAA15 family ATPase/GTPase
MIKINKIKLQNFRFFADDEQNNTFEISGQNTLIYGENGSGKSSLFKAFEFLSTPSISIDAFREQKNIFKSNDETYLEFDFSNDETLRIDEDHLSLDGNYNFIEKLSVLRPLLDYKSLLRITYEEPSQGFATEKNLYSFFEKILEGYPVENDKTLKDLSGEQYFGKYKQIIKDELLDEINILLEKFNHDFKIVNVEFDSFDRTVFLKIDFFDQDISKYHLFLNEARLSALAMSVYFAIIKKQFELLDSDSLKILVLDDLLISLDMNNRMNLIDILKSEFGDYQIFFSSFLIGLI